MNWLNAMNNAVEYMEDNITEKLDIEKVAKIALSLQVAFIKGWRPWAIGCM